MVLENSKQSSRSVHANYLKLLEARRASNFYERIDVLQNCSSVFPTGAENMGGALQSLMGGRLK